MKLLKQRIISLFYFAQRFDPLKNIKNSENYLSYNFLYGLLPSYLPASVRKATGELRQRNYLDRIVREKKIFWRLTSLGEKQFREIFQNYFFQKRSRQRWLLAIIRQNKEARIIRENLKKCGFAKLRESVYLACANKDLLTRFIGLEGKVIFIWSATLDFIDEGQLVNKLWNIDKYYSQYNDFSIRLRRMIGKINEHNKLSNQEIMQISALSYRFFIILKKTIGLSKNLLPNDWPLPKASRLFGKLLQIYAEENKF